jgi:glycosyltransferase involved in cell wall biosynthesis
LIHQTLDIIMPKLTVLMTVYNGEAYLRETIDSILNQTYKDFKFLILDNASTDGSREIIRSYNDPRIELVALPENIGQIAALNRGLDMSDTLYVGRIDADDISLPQRFERQVEFMDSHPRIGVCGTFAFTFGGKKSNRFSWPCTSEDIKARLLFECVISHPSVVIRKSFFDKYKLRYNEELGHSEDWELWQKASAYFELANIPGYLLKYRVHSQNVSKITAHMQLETAKKLDTDTLTLLGLEKHPLRFIHREVSLVTFNAENKDRHFLEDVRQWFSELQTANRLHRVYAEEALDRLLKERLFIVITKNTHLRGEVIKIFAREKLYRYVKINWTLKFLVKIILSFLGITIKTNENTVH